MKLGWRWVLASMCSATLLTFMASLAGLFGPEMFEVAKWVFGVAGILIGVGVLTVAFAVILGAFSE